MKIRDYIKQDCYRSQCLTWRFLTWKGHPAGINTASPKCCSNDHGSTPDIYIYRANIKFVNTNISVSLTFLNKYTPSLTRTSQKPGLPEESTTVTNAYQKAMEHNISSRWPQGDVNIRPYLRPCTFRGKDDVVTVIQSYFWLTKGIVWHKSENL